MLRRANEHETAAFLLVERTLQRTRPRVGPLGLKAVHLPDGRIERNPLGRLRVKFDGRSSDFEPENRTDTRALSEHEMSLWNGLQRIVSATKPVADNQWNLLSMRIGPRVLRRLPLGGVVTYMPNGTPPFKGTFSLEIPTPKTELSRAAEAALLEAIDVFIRDEGPPWALDASTLGGWAPATTTVRQNVHIVMSAYGHGRRRGRGKFYKCPMCHTPVVIGPYNPRIPHGTLRPGAGSIRDLRGGYLSRLRETYLVPDPNSLIKAADSSFAPRIPPREHEHLLVADSEVLGGPSN